MTGTPSERYDLAVVGAGPAGLAGAVTAAEQGLRVALLDAAAHTGGQFYRHPAPAAGATRPETLHHDWSAYTDLRDRLARSDARHLPGHHVWSVTRDDADAGWSVHAVTGDDGDEQTPVRVRARAVLLATGAYERHLPFPGWTLPGVVAAGGAQAMLKSGLVLPGRRVVVAGSGPLLLAVATSLAAAGARIPALVEATGYLRYARSPRALAANPRKAAEALVHGAALLRHRVPVRTGSAVTEAHGTDRVEAVTVMRLDRDWRPVPGTERRIACDALAVGHGLVPHIDLATTLGCATRTLPDGTTALRLDDRQETSVRGVWSAGETAGVGGAGLARTEGELAAQAIAVRLRGRTARVRPLRRRRDRLRAFATAMTAAHAPGPGWSHWLSGDTEVCRCEEVTADRVHEAIDTLGAHDPRTVKLLTRAGMGWCQGRMCGQAVACLTAAADQQHVPPTRRAAAPPETPAPALPHGSPEARPARRAPSSPPPADAAGSPAHLPVPSPDTAAGYAPASSSPAHPPVAAPDASAGRAPSSESPADAAASPAHQPVPSPEPPAGRPPSSPPSAPDRRLLAVPVSLAALAALDDPLPPVTPEAPEPTD